MVTRVVIGAAVGIIFALALPSVRLEWFDPRDYYTYQGTSGPFALVADAEGSAHAGQPISRVHAGSSFGWISRLCYASGVNVRASVELRDENTGAVVNQRETVATPDDHRCGDKLAQMQVPADAAPGLYSAERTLVIQPSSGPPVSTTLPPIEIEVLAP